MFDLSKFGQPEILPLRVLALVGVMLAVEWLNRDKPHALSVLKLPRSLRWACYLGLGYAIVLLSSGAQTFIYFQF
jgi:hypothetical protein